MLRLAWNETADKLFLETAVCKEKGPEAWDDQLSSGGRFSDSSRMGEMGRQGIMCRYRLAELLIVGYC